MNHEEAHSLSVKLCHAGVSHSIVVGVHDSLSPRVNCRIELHVPPGGIDAEEIHKLAKTLNRKIRVSFLDGKLHIEEEA